VKILERKLQSIRDEIQIELMQWLISRDHCGFMLFDSYIKKLKTRHSNKVWTVNEDYAKLMYTKDSNLCECHGVVNL
jgi:hypothetical protein